MGLRQLPHFALRALEGGADLSSDPLRGLSQGVVRQVGVALGGGRLGVTEKLADHRKAQP
jgi:hypothetical protein